MIKSTTGEDTVGAAEADLTEDQGVRAICYLQAVVGIKEPEARARKEWRNFPPHARASTTAAFFCMGGTKALLNDDAAMKAKIAKMLGE